MKDINLLKTEFDKYRLYVIQRKGALDSLLELRKKDQEKLVSLQEKQILQHKALLFLQSETIERRKNAQNIIESLGTFALQAIYDDSYYLELESGDENSGKKNSDVRNLKMEFCVKNQCGDNDTPIRTGLMGERGGGVVEVVSFALRIAALSLLGYDGPLIVDEAYKSMSNDQKLKNVASFLRQIADDIGRQIIFATHKDDIFGRVSDKIVRVVKNKSGIAEVKEESISDYIE